MIRALSRLIFFPLLLPLCGCAYVTATPAPPGSSIDGIRIYDVKPLLVVAPSNVSVVLVPNYNRPYALRFGSFLAKHDFTVDLQSGLIGHLESNQDSTAVPVAILSTISEVAKAFAGKALAGEAQTTSGGRLQVYDIVFDELGNLVELRPLITQKSLIKVAPAPTFVGEAYPSVNAPSSQKPASDTVTDLPGGQAGKPPTKPTKPTKPKKNP